MQTNFFTWRIQAGIFLLGLTVRLILISLYPTTPVNDLLWNDAVGWNLAQGNGFTASQSEPRVPGIFRTPAYPLFLAAVYRIWGHSFTAVYVAQCVLDAFSAILIGRIALYYFAPMLAMITSILYALYPYSAIFCGVLHQDILLVFCTLLMLLLLTKAVKGVKRSNWIAVGLLLGITALVKINFMLLFILPVLAIFYYFQAGRLLRLSLVAVAMMLVLSPWLIRNYVVFHTFPTFSAGPITNLHLLVVELNDGSQAVRDVGMAAPQRKLEGFTDGKDLMNLEEARTKQSLQEIKKHWVSYSLLILKHIPRLWITKYSRWHESLSTAGNILSWLVLSFGVAGMILVGKRWREVMLLYATVLLITLMYAPFIVEARYTLPARPIMLCFVSVVIAALARNRFAVSYFFKT